MKIRLDTSKTVHRAVSGFINKGSELEPICSSDSIDARNRWMVTTGPYTCIGCIKRMKRYGNKFQTVLEYQHARDGAK